MSIRKTCRIHGSRKSKLFVMCICHLTKSSLRTVFGFPQGLEPVVPMLELSMIVSLTYDERQSYVARFCNSRPIKWLGEISMSFYMCHMVNAHTTRRLFILLLMREILERPLLFVQLTV